MYISIIRTSDKSNQSNQRYLSLLFWQPTLDFSHRQTSPGLLSVDVSRMNKARTTEMRNVLVCVQSVAGEVVFSR